MGREVLNKFYPNTISYILFSTYLVACFLQVYHLKFYLYAKLLSTGMLYGQLFWLRLSSSNTLQLSNKKKLEQTITGQHRFFLMDTSLQTKPSPSVPPTNYKCKMNIIHNCTIKKWYKQFKCMQAVFIHCSLYICDFPSSPK